MKWRKPVGFEPEKNILILLSFWGHLSPLFCHFRSQGHFYLTHFLFLVIECTSGCYWSFLRALGEIHFGPICKQSYAYHPQLYNESWGCFLTLLFAKCHWSCHKIRLTQIGPCAQSVETHDTISFLAPLYFLWLSLGSNQVKTMNRSKMNQ